MRIHTIHNGCEANLADSEKAKLSFLDKSAFTYSTKDKADMVLFHGCTFTQSKEDETVNTIKDLLKTTIKTIIVSGCYLKEYIIDERVQYVKNEDLKTAMATLEQQHALDTVYKGNVVKEDDLLPLVTISRGCYGSCTFCSIKSVKGSNKSRKIEEILIDIEARQHLGYIKLVGDEVAGYGRDTGSSLKKLVDAIINKFPDIKIKLGSLNCKLLKIFKDDELKMFAYKNITGNIHIPIQSAANSVLKRMKRGYTIEEYAELYSKLKRLGVKNISGDIICGFPGETKSDHKKNLSFLEKNQFEFMEIFSYQERIGTKAASLEQLPNDVRYKRAMELIVGFIKNYSIQHNIPYNKLIEKQRIFNTNIKFK